MTDQLDLDGLEAARDAVRQLSHAVWDRGCQSCAFASNALEQAADAMDKLESRLRASEAATAAAVEAIRVTRALVSEAAMTGFNHADGDWVEKLFANQARLTAALPTPSSGGE